MFSSRLSGRRILGSFGSSYRNRIFSSKLLSQPLLFAQPSRQHGAAV